MKKQLKYLATAGLLVALLLAAGCGDDAKDKKPAPEPDKKVENVVVKPQDGKYYRYPSYIKDVTETPKMTPEIVKYIDDFASTLEFHPSYNGKFVNDSKINNPNEKYHAVYLYAIGPKHNKKIKFKNSKGKEVYQHQVYTKWLIGQSTALLDLLTDTLCVKSAGCDQSQSTGIAHSRSKTPTAAPHYTTLNNRIPNTQKRSNSIHNQ